MHQVQLSDQLFQEVQRRAAEAGFENVDDYVANVLKQDLEDPANFDHLFTSERLAQVDRAAAQIAAGEYLTAEEVRDHFKQKRQT
jgi:hypothetical protein